MGLFDKGPFGQTKALIKQLFKNSKIDEEEKNIYLARVKKIKKSNSGSHRSDLRNLTNELLKKNVEVIKLQTSTKDVQVIGDIEELEKVDITEEINSYDSAKAWLDQYDIISKELTIKGVNKDQILKSIGSPEYLRNIQDNKKYQVELDELIRNSHEYNFHDVAMFLKEKKDHERIRILLEKQLQHASQKRVLRVVGDIYDRSPEQTKKIAAEIYLLRGEYKIARDIYPSGELLNINLKKCAIIARSHHDFVTELYCHHEIENSDLVTESIESILKQEGILNTEKIISPLPLAQSCFENILQEKIRQESGQGNSKIFIQIKNLFKTKRDYQTTVSLLLRKLFMLGKYHKAIEIFQAQELEQTNELMHNLLSIFIDQIQQETIEHDPQEVFEFCEFLYKEKNFNAVEKLKKIVIPYFEKSKSKDLFMKFNELLWDISQQQLPVEKITQPNTHLSAQVA